MKLSSVFKAAVAAAVAILITLAMSPAGAVPSGALTIKCDTTVIPYAGGPNNAANCTVSGALPNETLTATGDHGFQTFSGPADANGAANFFVDSFCTNDSAATASPGSVITVNITAQTSQRSASQGFTVGPLNGPDPCAAAGTTGGTTTGTAGGTTAGTTGGTTAGTTGGTTGATAGSPPPGTSTGGTLARTGSNTAPLALGGAALLLAGGLMLLASRKRLAGPT